MDCDRFESMLEDLERDTAMPAGARAQAVQHAEECAHCRARLAGARVLSLALRAMAKADEKLQAPAHIEAGLVHALRQRARRRSAVWRRVSWASVAAAAIAVAGWLTAEQPWRHPVSPAPQQVQVLRSTAPTPGIAADSVIASHKAVRKRAPRLRPHPANRPGPLDAEDAFISLPYEGSWYPVGDSMVVRVEVPRSAPALVGLPMNGSDTSGTVTADVVLGQDGVARAIRFVPSGEGRIAARNASFR